MHIVLSDTAAIAIAAAFTLSLAARLFIRYL